MAAMLHLASSSGELAGSPLRARYRAGRAAPASTGRVSCSRSVAIWWHADSVLAGFKETGCKPATRILPGHCLATTTQGIG
uniref:Uncharacterized protein n=1 Tax=Arundo donax TaxID=35708 RepID=A0A0A9SUH7_ARUDO